MPLQANELGNFCVKLFTTLSSLSQCQIAHNSQFTESAKSVSSQLSVHNNYLKIATTLRMEF